ncbi:DMT family transporter [Rhodophyticola sp. MJ-SS7]|nr:DMT family transporter [Rhodophyticola sp. MJ-SS7]
MLGSTVFIATASLLAKTLTTGAIGPALSPLQVSHGRFIFALLAIAGAALALRLRFHRVNLPVHIARTFCGWAGISLLFAAIAFIPLSDATAISFLNPVFAMLLAIPLLGERVGPWRIGAACLAFAGALVLLRPGQGALETGALLALGAALILGFEIILIKWLSRAESPLQILLVNNAIGTVIATLAVLFVWVPPTGAQWAALAAIGVTMACAQGCFVNAMARAEASLVVPFSYATLLVATLFDAAVFGVIPGRISLTGGAMIVAAGLVLAWRESRLRPSGDSPS